MVDLNKVALFARVVEAGSFSGAARGLGMPKASVSRRVAQLEASLGVRLLHRTTRRIELTAMGQVYLEEATRGLAQVDSANKRLLAVQSSASGVDPCAGASGTRESVISGVDRGVSEDVRTSPDRARLDG
jgi:DNA-binding transcriptional LysR family regulator